MVAWGFLIFLDKWFPSKNPLLLLGRTLYVSLNGQVVWIGSIIYNFLYGDTMWRALFASACFVDYFGDIYWLLRNDFKWGFLAAAIVCLSYHFIVFETQKR